jgi:hypothetical protein
MSGLSPALRTCWPRGSHDTQNGAAFGGWDDARGRQRPVVGATQPPQAPQECGVREMVPGQLRPLSCRTSAIVAKGLARSPTFRRLVDRIGEMNGIVYITDRYYVNSQTRRVLSGALSHSVSMAGAHRVLHVMVAPESGDRQLITGTRAPACD